MSSPTEELMCGRCSNPWQRPVRPGPKPSTCPACRPGDTEELTCRECGATWTRKVTRGRKPATCGECQGRPETEGKTQRCQKCGEDLPLSAFRWRPSRGTFRTTCQSCRSNRARLRAYGLTVADYERLFQAQDGSCGICNTATRLVIDHDHNTGDVRGLLCERCNSALGTFGDDVDGLKRAMDYLEAA